MPNMKSLAIGLLFVFLVVASLFAVVSLRFGVAQNSSANTFIYTSTGSGGSISPSGNISVSYGDSQTFTITPNVGYQLAGVSVNQTLLGPVTSYTIQDITGATTISAWFNTLSTPTPVDHSQAGGGYGIERYPNNDPSTPQPSIITTITSTPISPASSAAPRQQWRSLSFQS